jgi:O-acetyl-ADP-ribose deacetylase
MLDGRLIVETGDITQKNVEAIINAANSSLMGGGGVDGAIHRRGGPSILEACRQIREQEFPDGLPAGRAVATTGGNLPCKHVIHTVGPVWRGGGADEKKILAEAYRNSLSIAADSGFKSVAFPAIATGIYGFPKELAAHVSYDTIQKFLAVNKLPTTVYLVFFSESDRDLFLSIVKSISGE